MSLGSITPAQLAERMASGEKLVLLDVREDDEFALGHLEGSMHVKLGELMARVSELDPEALTVCICHHGIRSARAASWLATQEFDALLNLSGGVERWACEVDTDFPRY
jgi:rhodanese-related sulfurtransferase